MGLVGGLAAVLPTIYLTEYSVFHWQIIAAIAVAVAAWVLWKLPRWLARRTLLRLILATSMVLTLGLPLSTFLGITHSRFGLTVVGACPLPVFDVTVSSGGVLWFRDKTHRVTLAEIERSARGAEILVIGIGWDGAVMVDEDARRFSGARVEIFRTGDAVRRFQQLRREGKSVALILHSTC